MIDSGNFKLIYGRERQTERSLKGRGYTAIDDSISRTTRSSDAEPQGSHDYAASDSTRHVPPNQLHTTYAAQPIHKMLYYKMKQKERVSTEPSRADITMNEIGIYTMKMRSGGVRTLKVDSVHTSPHRLVDSPEGNTTTRHRTPEPRNISQDQTC